MRYSIKEWGDGYGLFRNCRVLGYYETKEDAKKAEIRDCAFMKEYFKEHPEEREHSYEFGF